ncbi:hypothetical protein FQA39_LY13183 [Lamprigera yunnana]|nr:hypothetical protein FQA39_LY13183 [Lamprigera yunnana]
MDSNKYDNLFTEEFFKEDFKIDDYLSGCTQKSDLLTLRKDLKSYGVKLYTLMVDILKTETEGIVNLAENLTGLNVKIDDLYLPVSQLAEEIRTLYHAINDTKVNFKQYLDKVKSVINEKDYVNLKIGIISASSHINEIVALWENDKDITTLERAINEYSFQYLYLTEMGLEKVILQDNVQQTVIRLLELVDDVFFKALKDKDEEKILRCLRMYVNLARQDAAEECLKKNIVVPVLRNIFTQKNLDDHNQNIKLLYNQAIKFFQDEINLLLMILKRNSDLKGFNFVINSFWLEIDKHLKENLPNITAPGNPELFQKRFKDTWCFLEEIVKISGDENLFKSNPSFEMHMKRFNLPVYFEILFQQISAKFESELIFEPIEFNESDWKKLKAKEGIFQLKITEALWDSIKQCFNEEVYLTHLVDQILKLKMMLLSRYLKWFDAFLNKWKDKLSNNDIEQLEKFIFFSLFDMGKLKTLIGTPYQNLDEFDKTVFKIIPQNIRPTLNKIMELNTQLLNKMHEHLQQRFIYFKIQQLTIYLQQVTSIPRLYRRTNRNIPKKPSNYILETVSPIVELHRKYNEIMGDNMLTILDLIITQLGNQYLSLVEEVLHSVCKTEESLRRLKNRNSNANDESFLQGSGDTTTDEAKIREQIKKDVGYFVTELRKFSLENSRKMFQLLIEKVDGSR